MKVFLNYILFFVPRLLAKMVMRNKAKKHRNKIDAIEYLAKTRKSGIYVE